jgi:1A family penicillin-binding protein
MWSIFLLALGSAGTAVAVWLVMRDLPLADILPAVAEPSVSVETVDGKVLTTQGGYQAPYVGFDEFPPHLVDAVLAVEDRRFFEHSGVDVRGISRAFYRNFTAGGVVEGGSTITQQLVKILYLEPERTISRKLQEAVLATTLERQLGKERIIELYLNSVYLGSGAYGMPAAAETYYGKDVSDLSLPEAATLAATIQLPSRVNPIANLGAVQNRAGLVLSLMEDQGRIDEATRDQALEQLALLAPEPPESRAGSYFADWVLEEVEELEGASSQSLSATATLDPELQAEAERIVQRIMAEEGAAAGASQAAVVVMTPSGRVRVMVGGLNYAESQFNRATDAMRQPGSTFKTFVFMAALVMGASVGNVVEDTPIEIAGWAPQNFDGRSHGSVTLRDAFAHSYNQATVRLAQAVGNENIIEVARRFGIEAELKDTPSLALGASEITLLDMTEAFAALALGRMPVNATGIETLRFGEDGQAMGVTGVNDREQTRLTRTREPMLELLRAVVTDGTGRAAAIDGLDIVGKTGTSQESRDAWFIGFAQGQSLVIGVWVGNDDNSPMDKVTGGGIPARIFREVMLAAVARQGPTAGTVVAGQATGEATPAQVLQTQAAQPLCDVRACSAAYRSFDASDCTYQPWEGPRRLCTR